METQPIQSNGLSYILNCTSMPWVNARVNPFLKAQQVTFSNCFEIVECLRPISTYSEQSSLCLRSLKSTVPQVNVSSQCKAHFLLKSFHKNGRSNIRPVRCIIKDSWRFVQYYLQKIGHRLTEKIFLHQNRNSKQEPGFLFLL